MFLRLELLPVDIAEELMMFSKELPSPGPDTDCWRLICFRSVGGGVAGGARGAEREEEREREMPSARATLCLLSGGALLTSFGEDTAEECSPLYTRKHNVIHAYSMH